VLSLVKILYTVIYYYDLIQAETRNLSLTENIYVLRNDLCVSFVYTDTKLFPFTDTVKQ
jgi:hypothetical protein